MKPFKWNIITQNDGAGKDPPDQNIVILIGKNKLDRSSGGWRPHPGHHEKKFEFLFYFRMEI